MTLKVLEVRRERRLAALRIQEEEERKLQHKLEEEEMERQLQEQFFLKRQAADVEAKYTTAKAIAVEESSNTEEAKNPNENRRSEDFRRKAGVSFKLEDSTASNSQASSSSKASPKTSPKSLAQSQQGSSKALSFSFAELGESPKSDLTTPTRSPKISPISSTKKSNLPRNGTPRTGVWLDSMPNEYDDDSPLPSQKPSLQGKALNSYQSFTSTLFDLENGEVDPVKTTRRLEAYNVLTTKLVALWRNYRFRMTMETLEDAILHRKGRVLLEIVKTIRERWDLTEESIAHVKDPKFKYRNMYHLSASVGFIDCINGLGVTMLDVITRDIEGNNWLHMMTESPNIDFARRLHSFIQRYDQIIRSAQPVRQMISSLLTIISTPAPLQEGYLMKQNSGEKFQKRYVILTPNKLSYYYSDSQNDLKNPNDTILISVGQTVIRHNKDIEFSFVIDSLADIKSAKGKKRFLFRASSKEEYFSWLKALSQVTTVVTTRDSNAASSTSPVNIINSALTKLWVSEVNSAGDTPLHRLARGGVVKEDQSVNAISSSTILSEFEVSYQIISVAAWLIDGGCPIDTPNNDGETAFDLALRSQSYDLAAYLYRLGADYQHVKKKVIKDLIETKDCFKGLVYHKDEDTAPHLPPPERWYNFTYLSFTIQEIHLKSSNGRSSNNLSASFVRKNDELEEEYFEGILPCPYLAITVRDPRGRSIENPQILSKCGFRGLGVLVWGQTYHLQSPLQSLENKSIIDIVLVNFNPRTNLSEEIARGQLELDFSTINSGPASIFMESSLPSRQSLKAANAKKKSPNVEGFTLLADISLTQRSFDLLSKNLEEYVLTTFDLENAVGYNYKVLQSLDYAKNEPTVRFVGTLPATCAPGQVLRNFDGHRRVHVRVPSNGRPGETVIVEASVKKVYGRSFFYRDIEIGESADDLDDERGSVRSGRSSVRSGSPRASRQFTRTGSVDSPSGNTSGLNLSGVFDLASRTTSLASMSGLLATPKTPSPQARSVSPPAFTSPRSALPDRSSIHLKSGI